MIFLRLIRVPNLLIILLTMLAMRYGIMYAMLGINGFELQLSTFNFSLLVTATLFIAAAGYIINDYFDVKIDTINKPNDTLIGVQFKRRWAMLLHTVFNLIGIAMALYVSVQVGNYRLSFVYMLAATLLWFYSTSFKKQLIIGNVVVSFLASLIPMIPGFFEMPLLYKKYAETLKQYEMNFNYISYFLIGFAVFAFAISLLREIVKDMEDQQGDEEYGCETMPIVFGTRITNYIAAIVLTITMGTIGYLQYLQYISNDNLSVYYITLFVQLPLLIVLIKLLHANAKAQYSIISKLIKLTMLTGIMYAFVIHYEIVHPALQPQATEQAPSVNIGGGY
ncbi:MAG: geranylgeranylglycerol-phosphate geranylgeranyltransferase [Bacteroidia bacterium]|nr:geranylgeranylglycerol-phosphate geranylgeranyltransferase [Bacteroidia bacterium]